MSEPLPSHLVDPFGRNMDVGVIQWMRVGPPDNRTFHLMCRHAETTYYEREGTDSEGVVMSRLVDRHRSTANASKQSYLYKWLCFCVPHKGDSMTAVAKKKEDCSVCSMGRNVFEAVNEAIWDGTDPAEKKRVWGHAKKAMAIMATHGNPVDPRTIYRHRSHIEAGVRFADDRKPQTTRELSVYATDFTSVTDRVAGLGMHAAALLERRIHAEDVDDKTLASVLQTGLKAVTSRQVAERADRTPQINIQAIFGVSGGFLTGEVNEYRVIEGQSTAVDLKAEIEAKRGRLKELQAG